MKKTNKQQLFLLGNEQFVTSLNQKKIRAPPSAWSSGVDKARGNIITCPTCSTNGPLSRWPRVKMSGQRQANLHRRWDETKKTIENDGNNLKLEFDMNNFMNDMKNRFWGYTLTLFGRCLAIAFQSVSVLSSIAQPSAVYVCFSWDKWIKVRTFNADIHRYLNAQKIVVVAKLETQIAARRFLAKHAAIMSDHERFPETDVLLGKPWMSQRSASSSFHYLVSAFVCMPHCPRIATWLRLESEHVLTVSGQPGKDRSQSHSQNTAPLKNWI